MKPQPIGPTPAVPVSIAEARDYVREVTRDRDAEIGTLIGAAVKTVHKDTRLQLPEQQFRWTFTPCEPHDEIELRPAPLVSVQSLTAIHSDDTEEAVDLADFDIDTAARPGTIAPKRRKYWPTADCFRIEYTTGHAILPDELRLLVLMLIAHWYEAPEAAGEGTVKTVPLSYVHIAMAMDPHGDAVR